MTFIGGLKLLKKFLHNHTSPDLACFSGGGGNFVLSTSFVGYTPVYGGVVPMVAHGYGTFYKIEQNK